MVQKDDAAVKRRGRPRAYDPDKAVRRATDAFWKSGYAGTSLDAVSAATGMNRPSLHAAFGDKRDIYLAALRAYWNFKFATMREALAGGSLREALTRVYEAALSIYFSSEDQARGCFVVGTAITEAVEDAEIRQIAADGFHGLDADFAARFDLAREAGELSKETVPDALALVASATMHSIAVRARAGAPREELRKLASITVDLICG